MTDIDAIRQRAQAATPGPWEAGDRWRVAGVLAKRFGEGKCAYCSYLGEPLWVGEDSINGRRMLAHHHRDEGDDINLHVITAGARGRVAGNYDYEAGGIVEPVDAEFVAHARTDIPALLAELDRMRAKLDQPCGSCHPCVNYADETWRAAARKPPHVITWDDTQDELKALRPVVGAARVWRQWYGNTNASYASACNDLAAAVGALPNPADHLDICPGYGCPGCKTEVTS